MDHKIIITRLTEQKVTHDPTVVELSCKLFNNGTDKKYNYTFLKSIKLSNRRVAVILHVVECMKNPEHPVMPDYTGLVDMMRSHLISNL
jgi:hypothetical protein